MPETTTKTPAKTPDDRKPKTGSPEDGYRFTIARKTYTLPPIGDEAMNVPASLTMDVIENPEDIQAQARLGFAILRLVADDEVIDALRTLSTGKMMEIVGSWMAEGESVGSSEQ